MLRGRHRNPRRPRIDQHPPGQRREPESEREDAPSDLCRLQFAEIAVVLIQDASRTRLLR